MTSDWVLAVNPTNRQPGIGSNERMILGAMPGGASLVIKSIHYFPKQWRNQTVSVRLQRKKRPGAFPLFFAFLRHTAFA